MKKKTKITYCDK